MNFALGYCCTLFSLFSLLLQVMISGDMLGSLQMLKRVCLLIDLSGK